MLLHQHSRRYEDPAAAEQDTPVYARRQYPKPPSSMVSDGLLSYLFVEKLPHASPSPFTAEARAAAKPADVSSAGHCDSSHEPSAAAQVPEQDPPRSDTYQPSGIRPWPAEHDACCSPRWDEWSSGLLGLLWLAAVSLALGADAASGRACGGRGDASQRASSCASSTSAKRGGRKPPPLRRRSPRPVCPTCRCGCASSW